MPTYEYGCTACKNEWEELQKITEPALDECPKCHQKTAQRLISGGSFILKGGGWYADLYSSSKPKGESKSEGTGAASAASSSAAAPAAPAAAPASTAPAAPAAPSTAPKT
jgi:putative FmdB family regulatory protein